jgi:selenide,water dikinase
MTQFLSKNGFIQYMKKLVLLGGGHSHAEVLRQFAMRPPADTDITVVTRDLLAPYSGMLPGFIAGHYTYADIHIDIRNLAKAAGARIVHSESNGLDTEERMLRCPGRPDIPFDILSINTGSTPALDDAPGADQFAIPAKPVDQFIQKFETLLEDAQGYVASGYPDPDAEQFGSRTAVSVSTKHGADPGRVSSAKPAAICIVGGGAGGIELALTMNHRLTTAGVTDPSITVITDSQTLLPTHNPGVQKRVLKKFQQRNITLITNQSVTHVEKDAVRLSDGTKLPYSKLIWTTHAAAPDWIARTGMETDPDGFILVNDNLQSTSHPNIFAGGDIATMQSTPRPKSGVFAVRQGPYLTDNIRAAAENKPLTKFDPQKQFLSLLGTGDLNAIASKGPWAAQGKWVWDWKNHIDQKFMFMYEMAAMAGMSGGMTPSTNPSQRKRPWSSSSGELQSISGAIAPEMHCGGCGSKIGQSLLEQALAEIDVYENPQIHVGLNHPDDAAVVQYPPNTEIVHTVDHFKSFIDDPYIFGQVTAAHCLSDCYAMGAAPHNALATVTLAHGSDVQQAAILRELLLGANKILRGDRVTLVGGHTAEGQELSFGLTINGTINPQLRTTKTGVQQGDTLILTKPIGTGVLFAADMQKQARTYWLDNAMKQMIKTNKQTVDSLQGIDVSAATDLTGFGIIGHLAEMMAGSNLQARLNINAIPLLDGALECSNNGIASTLYPQNLIAETNIANRSEASKNNKYPLMFDPQTSGGLLIAVPENHAHKVVAETDGAIIGTINSSNNSEKAIRII